jgi:hypothetical protein
MSVDIRKYSGPSPTHPSTGDESIEAVVFIARETFAKGILVPILFYTKHGLP